MVGIPITKKTLTIKELSIISLILFYYGFCGKALSTMVKITVFYLAHNNKWLIINKLNDKNKDYYHFMRENYMQNVPN